LVFGQEDIIYCFQFVDSDIFLDEYLNTAKNKIIKPNNILLFIKIAENTYINFNKINILSILKFYLL